MAKATYLLRKASELVREKRYQDAVEVYLRATEAAPSDSRAWFGLGVCLFRVGNLDVSRIALERARHMGYPRADEALARVMAAEQKRSEQKTGAHGTAESRRAEKRATERNVGKTPPPRPTVRSAEDRIDLVKPLRIMLVEEDEKERATIKRSIEGCLSDVEVVPVPYSVSTSETMSGTVHYDVAVLDWDKAPDATAGLIQILKIKRPTLFVVCLTDDWDPETAVEVLEAGADYHLVKNAHFCSALPLILAQWSDRDYAVVEQESGSAGAESQPWSEALDAVGEMLLIIDADGTVVHANAASLRGFARGEEQMIGSDYADVFYAAEDAPESCPVQQAVQTGEASAGYLERPGLGASYAVNAWPIVGTDGEVAGATVCLRRAEAGAGDYGQLVEAIDTGVAVAGPVGKLEYVNAALCGMLARERDALVGQPMESIFSAADQDGFEEYAGTAQAEGRASARLNLRREDDTMLPVEARFASLEHAGDRRLVVSLVDVSETAAAAGAAEAGSAVSMLDDAIDKVDCGIVTLDDAGNITWLNAMAARFLGSEKEALRGASYAQALTAALETQAVDGPGISAAIASAHAGGETVDSMTMESLSGQWRFEYSSKPVQDGPPAVRRVEQFMSVSAAPPVPLPVLDENSDALAHIAASVADMLFAIDQSGTITWCNQAAATVSGYSWEQLAHMTLADLAPGEERWQMEDIVRDAIADGAGREAQEVLIRRADGRRRWMELTLLPGSGDEEAVVHGILRDVTDRKMNEAIHSILAGQREEPVPQVQHVGSVEDWGD